jgi:hypothetical protein
MIFFENENIPHYIKNKLSLEYSILDKTTENDDEIPKKIIDCAAFWGINNKNEIQKIINMYNNFEDDIYKTFYIFLITDNCDSFYIPKNVKLYRTSLLKSIKSPNEYILPYIWEFSDKPFEPLEITTKPVVGFCGFISHHSRLKTIEIIKNNDKIDSNFIIRDHFWGGNPHNAEIIKTFEDNIRDSHFTICNRGTGNFSMRFYQTLLFGRIPIILNTDLILPFEDVIDWNEIIVIADSEEELINKLLDVWNNKDIIKMQKKCREIYETYFYGTKFLDKILG